MASKEMLFQRVMVEQYQGHETRKHLYQELEEILGKPIISYFTSFLYPVMIEDQDSQMIEGLLQKCNLDDGFILFINSPGGIGIAAERIINVCRSYSGSGEYTTLVVGKAKSAATMVSLGSSEIIMGTTSELGSIDPQIVMEDKEQKKRYSIYNIVKSYEDLFNRAIQEKGNLEPYLQQLANYDARDIAEYKLALSLSEDIAVKALHTGMLTKCTEDEIRSKIKRFLDPEEVKDHARPIYNQDAVDCGLNVRTLNVDDELWLKAYELYYRLDNFVSINNNSKCIECADNTFFAKWGDDD